MLTHVIFSQTNSFAIELSIEIEDDTSRKERKAEY